MKSLARKQTTAMVAAAIKTCARSRNMLNVDMLLRKIAIGATLDSWILLEVGRPDGAAKLLDAVLAERFRAITNVAVARALRKRDNRKGISSTGTTVRCSEKRGVGSV